MSIIALHGKRTSFALELQRLIEQKFKLIGGPDCLQIESDQRRWSLVAFPLVGVIGLVVRGTVGRYLEQRKVRLIDPIIRCGDTAITEFIGHCGGSIHRRELVS
jgi:hypothetical protein